ncbi:MAG TPA: VOC family protein [Solirubrobacteraceae bacterium]|jgi:catechol 2,3-dioxygenase|nr:VOC family protein [Solirubrobacteraceae bacterium]
MITAVRSVDLRVDDLDAATAFYSRVVGLEAGDGATLRAPGGEALVRLSADGVTARAPRRAAGLFHTAFRFPTRADLADALRRAAPYLTGASDHGVSEALYLDDPAGNGVELYWDRPRDVWPDDMFTAALDLEDLAAQSGGGARAPEGTDVGHVHLKVSDLPRAEVFWVGVLGFEVMHRYGDQAAFVATGGYHHHVGLNTWISLGRPLAPREAAGLDRVVFATDGEEREAADPDGIAVRLEP